jgi:hypothetical protein
MSESKEKEFQKEGIVTPAERLDLIEETLLKEDVLGFDPLVLSLLDDPNASQKDIENLKVKLGPDIFNHLFGIANSAYHGSLKAGKVQHFFDVVTRLGMEHTKVVILMFAMQRLVRGVMEAELLYAKSFASSVVGRILARGLGFRDDAARKVELGCLLFHFGFLMMLVYRNRYQDGEVRIDDVFIGQYQFCLTERIINRFQLPDYLLEMVNTRSLDLERLGISLSGVVRVAVDVVEMSFRQFDNRLVIQSPKVSPREEASVSLGIIIEEQFAAAGLRKYLQIVEKKASV